MNYIMTDFVLDFPDVLYVYISTIYHKCCLRYMFIAQFIWIVLDWVFLLEHSAVMDWNDVIHQQMKYWERRLTRVQDRFHIPRCLSNDEQGSQRFLKCPKPNFWSLRDLFHKGLTVSFQIFWDGGSKFSYNRCVLLNMFIAAHCPVIFENPSLCLFGGSGKKSCKIKCCLGKF